MFLEVQKKVRTERKPRRLKEHIPSDTTGIVYRGSSEVLPGKSSGPLYSPNSLCGRGSGGISSGLGISCVGISCSSKNQLFGVSRPSQSPNGGSSEVMPDRSTLSLRSNVLLGPTMSVFAISGFGSSLSALDLSLRSHAHLGSKLAWRPPRLKKHTPPDYVHFESKLAWRPPILKNTSPRIPLE